MHQVERATTNGKEGTPDSLMEAERHGLKTHAHTRAHLLAFQINQRLSVKTKRNKEKERKETTQSTKRKVVGGTFRKGTSIMADGETREGRKETKRKEEKRRRRTPPNTEKQNKKT